jgi:hypothetical protein
MLLRKQVGSRNTLGAEQENAIEQSQKSAPDTSRLCRVTIVHVGGVGIGTRER